MRRDGRVDILNARPTAFKRRLDAAECSSQASAKNSSEETYVTTTT
jgi:hypothetical protein